VKNEIARAVTLARLAKNQNRVTVDGDSMLPLLASGDTVTVEPPQPRYRVGDVVLAIDENQGLIVHRIVRIRRGVTDTKGDNAVRVEQRVDVLGRIAVRRRRTDRLVVWLSLRVHRVFLKTDYETAMRSRAHRWLEKLVRRQMK